MTERTLPSARLRPGAASVAARRPALVLAVIVTCQLMLIVDVTVMNIALPRIQNSLGFSPTGLSWVITAYTLVFGGLLLLGGRLGDLLGRRRIFVAGTVLFTAASLVGGFATSPGWLLAARVVQGVGAAAAGPNTLALLTTTFTQRGERIRVLAIFSGVASGGFAIGLLVGGLLTELLSWRWVLFINVPFGLAIAVLAPRLVAEPERHEGRLDLPGAVTATAGVAALVYAFIHAASTGWSDRLTIVAMLAGVVLVAAFLLIEARTAQPLLPLHLFADRDRATAFLNFFLGPMAMASMFFFLTQFLQRVYGLSALATGFAYLPLALAMFAMTRLMPRLMPRLGPKPLAIVGTLAMALGLGLLTQLTPTSGYLTGLLVPLVLAGLGGGLAFAPLNVVIMSSVPARDAGAAGGVLQTMQQVGATLGLAVLVTVFGIASRHAAHLGATKDGILVAGMTRAFAVATLIALCTTAVAFTFRRGPAPRT